MENVIEFAKQAGVWPEPSERIPPTQVFRRNLEQFAKLVGNAKLTEAIDKARIFGLGLPIADTERLIKALESLKEPI